MKNLKLLLVVMAFMMQAHNIMAQSIEKKPNRYIAEFGIGYPISLSNQHEDVATFLNLGYMRQVNEELSLGYYAFSAIDVSGRADFSGGIGVRLGKKINNHSASLDIGYTLMSKKYGKFPGPIVGINLPLSDKLGLHVRYKQLSSAELPDRKVFEIGINVGEYYIKRAVLPSIGLLAIGAAIIGNAISNSR